MVTRTDSLRSSSVQVQTVAVIIIHSFILSFSPSRGLCQDEGADAIRQVREAIGRYENVDLQVSVQSQFTGQQDAVSVTRLRVKRLGPRIFVSTKKTIEQPKQDAWRRQQDFIVDDGGEVLDFEARVDSSLKQIEGQKGLSVCLHSERLAGSQEIDRDTVYFSLNDGGAAVWVVGYLPLLEYLNKASKVEVTSEETGEAISATCEYGQLKMIVSESSGWLPRWFQVSTYPEHNTTGGRVAEVYENAAKSVVWTGEVQDFVSNSDGRLIPTEIKLFRRTELKDKPEETIATTIKFENVVFDPSLSAADFQSDIVVPKGFIVAVMGADHLPYKWDGQAAVPGVPNLPARSNEAIPPPRDSSKRSTTQKFLIVFNVVAVVLIIGILLLRNHRSSGQKP